MMSDSSFDRNGLPSVSIVRITPEIDEPQLGSYSECYMGISLDNPVFRGKYLEALLEWAVEEFDSCLVIAGDYLRRHNEYILNGLDDEHACGNALAAGDEFIARERETLEKFRAEKVRLVRWRECLKFEEYTTSRLALDKLFATDSGFEAAVRKDAISFVDRQRKRNRKLAVTDEEAVNISCEYLLEEIAVFSALSERGRHVELYPGPELEVLVEIAEGKFADIPRGLAERVNVELKCNGKRNGTQ